MKRLLPIAMLVSLLAGPARANEATLTVVREQGGRANTAFAAGDFATAAELYRALEPLIATLPGREQDLAVVRFNLGRCHDELGHPVEAIAAYERSLTGPLDPELAESLRARVAEIEAEQLGAVDVRCPVDAARITIEGQTVEHTCGERFSRLMPGAHVLTGQTPDGRTERLPVDVTAGQVRTVLLWPQTEPDHTLAWTLTGSAVAAAAAGLAFNLLARDRRDEANALADEYGRRPSNDLEDQIRSLDDDTLRDAYVSYALFGLSATLAGFATWAWLDEEPTGLAARPVIGWNAVGIEGRF